MHRLLRTAGAALAATILSLAGAGAAAADAPRHDVAGPVGQHPAGPLLPGGPQLPNGEGDWP